MDLQRLSSRLNWDDRAWFDLVDHFSHWEIREVQRAGIGRDGQTYGRDTNGGTRDQLRLLEAELWFAMSLAPDGIARLEAVQPGRSNDQRLPEHAGQIMHVSLQGPHQNAESKWRLFVRLTEPERLDAFIMKVRRERETWMNARRERMIVGFDPGVPVSIIVNHSMLVGRCGTCGAEIPAQSEHVCENRSRNLVAQQSRFMQSNRAAIALTRENMMNMLRTYSPERDTGSLFKSSIGIEAQRGYGLNYAFMDELESSVNYRGAGLNTGAPRMRPLTPAMEARNASELRRARIQAIGSGFMAFEAHVKAIHHKIANTLPDGKPVLKRFRKLEMD